VNIGRNDPCPCGSGKKYKKCCLNTLQNNEQSEVEMFDKWFEEDLKIGQENLKQLEEKIIKKH